MAEPKNDSDFVPPQVEPLVESTAPTCTPDENTEVPHVASLKDDVPNDISPQVDVSSDVRLQEDVPLQDVVHLQDDVHIQEDVHLQEEIPLQIATHEDVPVDMSEDAPHEESLSDDAPLPRVRTGLVPPEDELVRNSVLSYSATVTSTIVPVRDSTICEDKMETASTTSSTPTVDVAQTPRGEDVSGTDADEGPAKTTEAPQPTTAEAPLTYKQIQLVFLALSVAAFLGSLDQSIIATAMPTIASQYNELPQQSWITLAYLLTSTVFQPIFGRGTDLYGSRLMLFLAIAIFDIGSLFCAVATDFIWFCVGRGIAGIGAAGLLVVCMIIVSQIVPLRDRGKYVGAMYARTAIATVLGPVLGGIFTRFDWRWCFWINLVLSGPAVGILVIFAKKIPNKMKPGVSFKDVDFGGIMIITTCVVALCLGLTWGGTTYAWNSPVVISLIAVGGALIPVYAAYEVYVPQFPLIPPHMFKIRNVVASTGNYLFTSVSIYGLAAYIPSYYQLVRGDDQLISGLEILPYAGTLVIFATLVGYLMSWTGRTRPFLWAGGFVNLTANGLLIMLDGTHPRAVEYVFMAICGAGVGFIAQTNTVSAQSKVARELLASVTTMTMWSKSLGSIIGIAAQGTIIQNVFLNHMLADPEAAPYIGQLKTLDGIHSLPGPLQTLASQSYGKAFSTMMIATTAFTAVGFLFSLTAEEADLNRDKKTEEPPAEKVREAAD